MFDRGKTNKFIVLFPRLFGAGCLALNRVISNDDMARLMEFLDELGAIKVGESLTPAAESDTFYFKIKDKWLVLICVEYKSPKLIAPKPLLGSFKEKFT